MIKILGHLLYVNLPMFASCHNSRQDAFFFFFIQTYWHLFNPMYTEWTTHTIYLKSPNSMLGMSGYVIYIILGKNGWTICKQWRPWSAATFCGIWSGSALFANYPFRGLETTMGQFLQENICCGVSIRSASSRHSCWVPTACFNENIQMFLFLNIYVAGTH